MNYFEYFKTGYLYILTVTIALFYLPQKIPLEFAPLNNPSFGMQYLDLSCSANYTGLVTVYYDTGSGFVDYNSIKFPVSALDIFATYTFPLLDKNVYKLKIQTSDNLGKIYIKYFRIINRKGDILYTIIDDHNVYTKKFIKTKIDLANPVFNYKNVFILNHKLTPIGMIRRNLERCMLSFVYLSFILILIITTFYLIYIECNLLLFNYSIFTNVLLLSITFSIIANRGNLINLMNSLYVNELY
jgi:hypothetical protein